MRHGPLMFKTLVARYDAAKEALKVIRSTYMADHRRFLKMLGDPNTIAEEKGRLDGVAEVIAIMETALNKRAR